MLTSLAQWTETNQQIRENNENAMNSGKTNPMMLRHTKYSDMQDGGLQELGLAQVSSGTRNLRYEKVTGDPI